MTTNESHITIHMASCLDGFNAPEDGSLSWLQSTDCYKKGVVLTEENAAPLTRAIDCSWDPGPMNMPWNSNGCMVRCR